MISNSNSSHFSSSSFLWEAKHRTINLSSETTNHEHRDRSGLWEAAGPDLLAYIRKSKIPRESDGIWNTNTLFENP